MQDTFGRTISYMRLSVTDKCNCRCIYCMPRGGVARHAHGEVLSFEEMAEIVRAASRLGVRKVRVTGGEPLVRRGIVDLVAMLSGIEGIDEVDMTTNGTLLAPLAKDLRAAGLTRLNVSLDTLRTDRYREISRVGELSDALDGIRAAKLAGFPPPKINCVLMGGVNDDEAADFVDIARREPVEVRFIELMPMGECASFPATSSSKRCPSSSVLARAAWRSSTLHQGFSGVSGSFAPSATGSARDATVSA